MRIRSLLSSHNQTKTLFQKEKLQRRHQFPLNFLLLSYNKIPQRIAIASTTLFLYCYYSSLSSSNKLSYFCCRAFSSTTKTPSTLFALATRSDKPTGNPTGKLDTSYTSSLCFSSSSFSSGNTMDQQTSKTTQELQNQWAGGIDVWKDVPISSSSSNNSVRKVNIQTKIKSKSQTTAATSSAAYSSSSSTSTELEWPFIIRNSILYGFGAYNPRGQTLPDHINQQQHLLLENDIRQGLKELGFNDDDNNNNNNNNSKNNNNSNDDDDDDGNKHGKNVFWWQGASLWEDGTSERGFIVAFQRQGTVKGSHGDFLDKAHNFIIELAVKYNQGAVYKFEYMNGKLIRDTIAVLDPGTDATVEVVQDVDVNIDLSIFDNN